MGRLMAAGVWMLATAIVSLHPAPLWADTVDEATREMLSAGYSLLYADVSGLQKAHAGLILKQESDTTEAVVGDMVSYLKVLEGELRGLAGAGIRIDLNPLPEAERRTQALAARDRILSFAPVIGRAGEDFERTLLLTLAAGLNQLRHMALVLEGAEAPGERKQLMDRAATRLQDLQSGMEKVLNERFYTVNANAS